MPEPRPIYPKHFYAGPPVPRARTGFILMPFKPFEDFEPVHEAIRTAIENAGLDPQRADDIFTTGAVLEKILRQIAEAEVVVADLTGKNANVFYETGIAHTVKDNVVLLAQDIEDIPVDLRPFEYIVYEQDPDGLQTLSERLENVIAKLEPEPAYTSVKDMSPAEIRRELLRLLQVCERKWKDSVIPEQIEFFQRNFSDYSQFIDHKSMIEKAISDIQPAFLLPWHPIENMGFEVIDRHKEDVLPEFIEALARAYNLSGTQQNDVPMVWGHGQLLALRTWTLWGAKALKCKNWDAVTQLLHYEVEFHNVIQREIQTSFCRYSLLHTPDAAALKQSYGNDVLAARSIYRQSEEFTQGLFLNLTEMQAFIGLWLFATDLARAGDARRREGPIWPSWVLAPHAQLQSLFRRIESDAEYAQNFAQAVVRKESTALNPEWQGRLRDWFVDRRRLAGEWDLDFPKVPQHFAE